MSLPNLTLQTDKNNTSVDIDRITIRQSESGLVLIADLITATGEAYDLTDCSIAFGENKDGGKMVSDDNVDIIDAKNGRISYRLNTVVYQASGDAWFEITDTAHKLIDTTTNIRIDVVKQADLPVDNDNYWSKAEGMLTHVQAIIDKMQNDINANATANTDKLNEFIKSFNDKLDQYKAELADYDQKYKQLSDDWAAELEVIKGNANSDISKELDSLKSNYESWKLTVSADFQKQIDKLKDELSNAEKTQNSLKADIDSAMAAVDKIQGVDFTQFAHKEDLDKFYDKATIDEKLKNAGTLKQISVNGGTPISPDDKGVANIDIDSVDLANYETKEDANSAHNDLKTEINKRPLTVNNVSPDDKGNISLSLPQQLVQTVENQKPDANGNIQIFNRKLTPYKFLTGNNDIFIFDSTNQTFYVISEINDTYYLFKLDFDYKKIKYVTLTSGIYYGISIINNKIYICGTAGIFAYDENLQKQYSYSINGVYFYNFFSSNKCLYVTAGDNNVYKMTFALTYLDKKDFTDGYSPQIVLDPNTGKIYGIAQYHENKLYILNESLQVEKTVSLDIQTIAITIINNSIYILTNNSLNKLNSSLSVQKQVSFNTTMLDTSNITNDDNSIYFLENQYIHEFDFDLNEKSKTSFFSDSFSIQNINNDYICAMYNQSNTNRPLVMLKKNASLIDAIEGIYNYLF